MFTAQSEIKYLATKSSFGEFLLVTLMNMNDVYAI